MSRPIRYLGLTLAAVVIAALVWFGARFLPPAPPPDLPAGFRGERAVWMGIEWAMEAKTDADVAGLARDLRAHHISDVYAYVSYLKADGVFNPTYDHAAAFTTRLRALVPEIRLWGWVGVPIQVKLPTGEIEHNRLDDPATRTTISAFAGQVVSQLGFDGIHLNAEAIANGDAAYLETLRSIRVALPDGGRLSVAPHALRLTEAILSIPYPAIEHQWTPDYLQAVAGEVDQVAVMLYDSGLFTPGDVRAWTAYQVRSIAGALATSETDVLIGLPVSEEWTLSHHPFAENLANGLYGLRAGLAQSESPDAIDGIALYPYWEIGADEWALVDGTWPPSPRNKAVVFVGVSAAATRKTLRARGHDRSCPRTKFLAGKGYLNSGYI